MHYEVQILCSQQLWEFELTGSDLSSTALLSGFHIQPLTGALSPLLPAGRRRPPSPQGPLPPLHSCAPDKAPEGGRKVATKITLQSSTLETKLALSLKTCHLQLEPHLQNSPFLGTLTPHLPGHQSPTLRVFQSSLSRNTESRWELQKQ